MMSRHTRVGLIKFNWKTIGCRKILICQKRKRKWKSRNYNRIIKRRGNWRVRWIWKSRTSMKVRRRNWRRSSRQNLKRRNRCWKRKLKEWENNSKSCRIRKIKIKRFKEIRKSMTLRLLDNSYSRLPKTLQLIKLWAQMIIRLMILDLNYQRIQ